MGKRELGFMLSFTRNFVVSVSGVLFCLALGIGCVVLLLHSSGILFNLLRGDLNNKACSMKSF